MSINYKEIYSSKNVTAKKLCFSAAILNFNPMAVISSLNAPKSNPILLSSFSDIQLDEIEKYLKGYNEKPYVIEVGRDIYVVIPSLYPTSSSCLLLRMNFDKKEFLRLVKDRPDLFVLSNVITASPARMSIRLEGQKKEFAEFCEDIEHAFMHLERFSLLFSNEDVLDGYCEQVISLSSFLAVPIEDISVKTVDDGVAVKSNFALFTAFCTSIMMLARNEATDRKISVGLELSEGAVFVRLSFKNDKNIKITNETFLWDYLARDKRMLFEYHSEDERFCVSFQPLFIDWSYLGMKQERNDTFFEDYVD